LAILVSLENRRIKMGGFLLIKKEQNIPVEEIQRHNQNSIDVFKRKGLELSGTVVRDKFVIFRFFKYSLKTKDYNYPQKLDSELRCKLESAIARKEAWSDAEHA